MYYVTLQPEVVKKFNQSLEEDLRSTEQIIREVLTSKSLEDLCGYLDSYHDLYGLGYTNSKLEQKVLEEMAEMSALGLWSIHKYANSDVNMEYPFTEFVKYMEEVLNS